MKKIKAFTLAEILITLVVIGIIASLCIPALIQNTQKSEYVAALKKNLSNIASAYNLIKMDNAGSVIGVFTDRNVMMNLFCNKLNCVKTCQIGTTGCFTSSWKTLDGRSGWSSYPTTDATAILSDGTTVAFSATSSSSIPCTDTHYTQNGTAIGCALITIDVNGAKPPNVMGRDIFEIIVTRVNIRANGQQFAQWPSPTYCDPSNSTITNNGAACSARIMMDGAMNY